MQNLKNIEQLKADLIKTLEMKIEGNEAIMTANEKYFPENKEDIETAKQYDKLLKKLITTIEETR